MFGVGWGLAGYCPGPAIVSLGLAPAQASVFFATMLAGIFLGDALGAERSRGDAHPSADQAPAC